MLVENKMVNAWHLPHHIWIYILILRVTNWKNKDLCLELQLLQQQCVCQLSLVVAGHPIWKYPP